MLESEPFIPEVEFEDSCCEGESNKNVYMGPDNVAHIVGNQLLTASQSGYQQSTSSEIHHRATEMLRHVVKVLDKGAGLSGSSRLRIEGLGMEVHSSASCQLQCSHEWQSN